MRPGSELFDQISISELWSVVLRQKIIVFCTLLICMSSVGLYIVSTTHVYESRAVLAVGSIKQGLVEDTPLLITRLREKYRIDDEMKRQPPYLKSVEQDKKLETVIILKAYGASPQEAQRLLNTVTNDILQEHAQLFNNLIKRQENHLQVMRDQIANLDKALVLLNQQVRISSENTSLVVLLILQESTTRQARNELQEAIIGLEITLSPPFTKPSAMLKEPDLPERMAKPKILVLLVYGLIAGVVLGCLLAVFVDKKKG